MSSPDPTPARPTIRQKRARHVRRIVKRTLLGVGGVFAALVVLGVVLQATGAVPTSRPAGDVAALPAPTRAAAPLLAAPATTTAAATTTTAAPTTTTTTTAVAPPSEIVVAAAVPVVDSPAPAPKPAPKAAPKPAPKPQPLVAAPAPAPKKAPAPKASSSGYANCAAARAAGAAPLYAGQPGYSSKLDRDGDGVACE
jgi:outer membrane biosynthesis protein TonB